MPTPFPTPLASSASSHSKSHLLQWLIIVSVICVVAAGSYLWQRWRNAEPPSRQNYANLNQELVDVGYIPPIVNGTAIFDDDEQKSPIV